MENGTFSMCRDDKMLIIFTYAAKVFMPLHSKSLNLDYCVSNLLYLRIILETSRIMVMRNKMIMMVFIPSHAFLTVVSNTLTTKK